MLIVLGIKYNGVNPGRVEFLWSGTVRSGGDIAKDIPTERPWTTMERPRPRPSPQAMHHLRSEDKTSNYAFIAERVHLDTGDTYSDASVDTRGSLIKDDARYRK